MPAERRTIRGHDGITDRGGDRCTAENHEAAGAKNDRTAVDSGDEGRPGMAHQPGVFGSLPAKRDGLKRHCLICVYNNVLYFTLKLRKKNISDPHHLGKTAGSEIRHSAKYIARPLCLSRLQKYAKYSKLTGEEVLHSSPVFLTFSC